MNERVVILAHEKFPDRSKTANGILRYGDHEVVAVLDRDRAGDRVADHLPDVQDAPIVESFGEVGARGGIENSAEVSARGGIENSAEVSARGGIENSAEVSARGGTGNSAEVEGDRVDQLIVGIAPIGGGFDESWRPDVRAAIEAGCDVVSGLHYFLNDDEEFSALAAEHGVTLTDVRKPHEGLSVSGARSADVSADVVLTVGTDCSVGKMTATMELAAAAEAAGIDACVIPTGQTGIVIEGWGNPVDRVVSDFTAGAVEEMILEKGEEHDLLVVEGQASILHPAYSAVTCGILHGAMPDRLVLCHEAGRDAIHGYEEFDLLPPAEYVDRYESLAAPVSDAEVVAGALNTAGIENDADAEAAVAAFGDAIDAPATDLVRFGASDLVEAIR